MKLWLLIQFYKKPPEIIIISILSYQNYFLIIVYTLNKKQKV